MQLVCGQYFHQALVPDRGHGFLPFRNAVKGAYEIYGTEPCVVPGKD